MFACKTLSLSTLASLYRDEHVRLLPPISQAAEGVRIFFNIVQANATLHILFGAAA